MAFEAVEGSESASLVGMFFVVEGEEGWQGFVEKSVGPEHYVVQLYSWMSGDPTECKVISIRDAEKRNWSWFFEREAWAKFGSIKFAQGLLKNDDRTIDTAQRMVQTFKNEGHIGHPRNLRAEVLDLLRNENLSGSEIARRLKRGKSVVLECLDQLEGEDRIQRSGRAWVLVEGLDGKPPTAEKSVELRGRELTPDELAIFEENSVCPRCAAALDNENSSLILESRLRVHVGCPRHE